MIEYLKQLLTSSRQLRAQASWRGMPTWPGLRRLRNGDHSASYFTSSTNEDEGGQRKVSPFASD